LEETDLGPFWAPLAWRKSAQAEIAHLTDHWAKSLCFFCNEVYFQKKAKKHPIQ
jgi:hypothetical protein